MTRQAPFSLALLAALCVACKAKVDLTTSELSCDGDAAAVDLLGVSDALEDNTADHEELEDYDYDAGSATVVALDAADAMVVGPGATAALGVVTVHAPGTYIVSGTWSDGQLVVNAQDDGLVRLVLAGASISSSMGSALRVDQAERTALVLADGTVNHLSDASTRAVDATSDAVIWSADDLSVGGDGALVVTGGFEDGIASKDGLVIRGGDLTVTAVGDGVRGKDYLVVRGGRLDVVAGADGLSSDGGVDPKLGYVLIEGGTIDVDAEGDAVTAATDALVMGGTLWLRSGGGAAFRPAPETSAKGMKAGVLVWVDGGELDIDASDDGIHSDGIVGVSGGRVEIATADDGIHSEGELTISAGEVTIAQSHEGIEAVAGDINVYGGSIDVTATDDGFNLAGDGDDPGGVESAGDPYDMGFHGGRVTVNSGSDGIDSNGSIVMTGGCLVVNGPLPGTRPEQGAIDYNGDFEISGGILVASGAAGRMAQAPNPSSAQPSIAITFASEQVAGTVVAIEGGANVLSVAPTKAFQSVVVSAPWLWVGDEVSIYQGGSLQGDTLGGLADGARVLDTKRRVSLSSPVTEAFLR